MSLPPLDRNIPPSFGVRRLHYDYSNTQPTRYESGSLRNGEHRVQHQEQATTQAYEIPQSIVLETPHGTTEDIEIEEARSIPPPVPLHRHPPDTPPPYIPRSVSTSSNYSTYSSSHIPRPPTLHYNYSTKSRSSVSSLHKNSPSTAYKRNASPMKTINEEESSRERSSVSASTQGQESASQDDHNALSRSTSAASVGYTEDTKTVPETNISYQSQSSYATYEPTIYKPSYLSSSAYGTYSTISSYSSAAPNYYASLSYNTYAPSIVGETHARPITPSSQNAKTPEPEPETVQVEEPEPIVTKELPSYTPSYTPYLYSSPYSTYKPLLTSEYGYSSPNFSTYTPSSTTSILSSANYQTRVISSYPESDYVRTYTSSYATPARPTAIERQSEISEVRKLEEDKRPAELSSTLQITEITTPASIISPVTPTRQPTVVYRTETLETMLSPSPEPSPVAVKPMNFENIPSTSHSSTTDSTYTYIQKGTTRLPSSESEYSTSTELYFGRPLHGIYSERQEKWQEEQQKKLEQELAKKSEELERHHALTEEDVQRNALGHELKSREANVDEISNLSIAGSVNEDESKDLPKVPEKAIEPEVVKEATHYFSKEELIAREEKLRNPQPPISDAHSDSTERDEDYREYKRMQAEQRKGLEERKKEEAKNEEGAPLEHKNEYHAEDSTKEAVQVEERPEKQQEDEHEGEQPRVEESKGDETGQHHEQQVSDKTHEEIQSIQKEESPTPPSSPTEVVKAEHVESEPVVESHESEEQLKETNSDLVVTTEHASTEEEHNLESESHEHENAKPSEQQPDPDEHIYFDKHAVEQAEATEHTVRKPEEADSPATIEEKPSTEGAQTETNEQLSDKSEELNTSAESSHEAPIPVQSAETDALNEAIGASLTEDPTATVEKAVEIEQSQDGIDAEVASEHHEEQQQTNEEKSIAQEDAQKSDTPTTVVEAVSEEHENSENQQNIQPEGNTEEEDQKVAELVDDAIKAVVESPNTVHEAEQKDQQQQIGEVSDTVLTEHENTRESTEGHHEETQQVVNASEIVKEEESSHQDPTSEQPEAVESEEVQQLESDVQVYGEGQAAKEVRADEAVATEEGEHHEEHQTSSQEQQQQAPVKEQNDEEYLEARLAEQLQAQAAALQDIQSQLMNIFETVDCLKDKLKSIAFNLSSVEQAISQKKSSTSDKEE